MKHRESGPKRKGRVEPVLLNGTCSSHFSCVQETRSQGAVEYHWHADEVEHESKLKCAVVFSVMARRHPRAAPEREVRGCLRPRLTPAGDRLTLVGCPLGDRTRAPQGIDNSADPGVLRHRVSVATVWGNLYSHQRGVKRWYSPRPAGHFGSSYECGAEVRNISRARGEYRAGKKGKSKKGKRNATSPRGHDKICVLGSALVFGSPFGVSKLLAPLRLDSVLGSKLSWVYPFSLSLSVRWLSNGGLFSCSRDLWRWFPWLSWLPFVGSTSSE